MVASGKRTPCDTIRIVWTRMSKGEKICIDSWCIITKLFCSLSLLYQYSNSSSFLLPKPVLVSDARISFSNKRTTYRDLEHGGRLIRADTIVRCQVRTPFEGFHRPLDERSLISSHDPPLSVYLQFRFDDGDELKLVQYYYVMHRGDYLISTGKDSCFGWCLSLFFVLFLQFCCRPVLRLRE